MAYTLYPLKSIPANLVSRIAEIHMGDAGLLTKLGYPFVLRYFEGALTDKDSFGFFAKDEETGEIMGFSLASPQPSALTSKLTEEKIWFIRNIFKVMFTKPLAFLQMVISSVTIRGQMYEPNTIECVYFTVDPKFRGRGLGRTLQNALVEKGRELGYKKIYASVETWNIASLKATQANGFKIIKTFREGIYFRHRLERELKEA
ncbi:MAG: GNAT family N-acetyltransferase [Anaerolineales bacterium]|nr:GNAT family N-acetyltransferase [Anaerolineales bacterium]MCB9143978.1 GNAT family N-acetyltransferase [Anaerolineales bacterium]